MARPQFELVEETETADGGWEWRVQVLASDGGLTRHRLRLAWADYDLWSGGRASVRPVDVAEAAYAFLWLHAEELAARERVDCAWARRVEPEADARIPGMVRDAPEPE